MQKSSYLAAIGLTIIASATLYGIISAHPENQHSPTKQKAQKMKTVCVGRYSIDLPDDAAIELPSSRVGGITISSWADSSESQLQADISEREQELTELRNDYDRPSLEQKLVSDAIDFKATLLYYGREKPDFKVEFGKRIMMTQAWINAEAFGIKGSIAYHFNVELLKYPQELDVMTDLLKKFESRDIDKIPSASGFCTENGFVHDPVSPFGYESVTMFASLKGHPDVAIRFDTLVNADKIFESVLSRDANNDVKLNHPTAFTTFQSRARALNGIEGEEVLDKVKEANGTSAHIFMWASMGKKHDVLAPKITLELETGIGRPGEQINSSLSDKEVLELWEQISSSIRLRPVSAGKSSDTHAPDQTPLGTLVSTGRVCPQSGYWESSEAGEILGGHRQFLRAGEAMPEAVWLGQPSFVQRLRGERPSYRTMTVWKLAAYAPTNNVANAVAGVTNGDDSAQGRDSADGQAPPFPTPPESGTA